MKDLEPHTIRSACTVDQLLQCGLLHDPSGDHEPAGIKDKGRHEAVVPERTNKLGAAWSVARPRRRP